VKEAVSIYDVLSEHGIEVASRERREKLHCPVHDDRHKSAVVYPETGEIFCFAEQRSYDVVSLTAEWEGIEWWEACARLEAKIGIVYERQSNPQDRFWSMVRRKDERKMSGRQLYDLRWAVHRTVLELGKEGVDWDTFDELELTDVDSLVRWRDEQLG
jgi:DNA primase